jgi:hypothetical protein
VSEAADAAKAKIEALKNRLLPVTKAADLLAVARELEALGSVLAREEATAAAAPAWPRDMNEGQGGKEWGTDPKGTPRDG